MVGDKAGQVEHVKVAASVFADRDTAKMSTLSLHDALPISPCGREARAPPVAEGAASAPPRRRATGRRPARSEEHTLNSSHGYISYAVFCLKKKKRAHPTIAADQRSPASRGLTLTRRATRSS